MLDYGERKCLVCGKTFKPSSPSRITCSGECRDARRKEQMRRSLVKTRGSLAARLEVCEKKLAALEHMVKYLHALGDAEFQELCKKFMDKDAGVQER